jgi:hypothetical protein
MSRVLIVPRLTLVRLRRVSRTSMLKRSRCS